MRAAKKVGSYLSNLNVISPKFFFHPNLVGNGNGNIVSFEEHFEIQKPVEVLNFTYT
jgi:hypothetical protein